MLRPDMVSPGRMEKVVRYNLRTATGDAAAVEGECSLLVTVGGVRFKHRFIVAGITDQCILGLDFMTEHEILLDLKNQVLRWHNVEVPLQVDNNNHGGLRVITDERIEIPPMSEKVIYARINGDLGGSKVGMVEPANTGKDGILCGRTLVKLMPKIPVRVMNVSPTVSVIKEGVVIGKAEGVNSITSCATGEQHTKAIHPARKRIIRSLCDHLTGTEAEMAVRVLEGLADVFALNDDDMGRTDIVQHRIDTGNAIPIRQTPRRLPLAKQQEAELLIKKMERDGVIEKSSSPWSSPVVLVLKKDGSMRFCVDYRKLNDVTKKDSYPLPRIDDTLDTLSGANIFSTLDLKSGYWQVAIQEEDREKTAFTAGNGLYQFAVMPFGLCNAPATFERLMEHVLRGLNWRTCLVYLDDIIVLGRTFNEHLKNLQQVLQTIKAAGLKLNASKCSLFKNEVNYLGHIVSRQGVRTDPIKLAAVEEWRTPRNIHELRSFLGLCSYYRRFVPNFADVARSLHRLTEKTQPFNWAKEHEDAFVQLKKKLCSSPILAYPRAGDLFILDTDASNTGIGAVLSQNQGGTERVLAYYSRALSKPEKNYCVTRRELLAVVDSVKHFHKYLYGQEFLLRTDHAALKWLMQFKEPEGQVARWIERLQTYTFKTEHRRGLLHNNADGMSRRPCSLQCTHCSRQEQRDPIAQVSRIRVDTEDRWTREQLAEDQRHDHSIAPIIKWIEEGTRPQWHEIATFSATVKSYWAQWKSLKIENELLIRLWESVDGKDNKPQIVLPENRIGEVLQEIHNNRSGSHLGVNKTLDKIRLRFYWVNCRKDVEDWCRKCEVCAASKGPQTRTRGRMQQYNVGAPFERIAMDIAGPFPPTKGGNRYILVCIDYFSKWVEAYPIMNQEARTVADAFVNNWVCRFGVPLELHSDQGRNFESSVFQELCQILEIKKTRTTPLHPQSDGMVERFNRTLEEHLRKEVNVNQDNWDQCIPLFMMAYRSAIHDTTGYSPAMVVFGRELRLPCDVKFGSPETEPVTKQDYTTELRQRMINVHATVRDNIVKASDRMKTRYDRRSNSIGFKEGDLVWLYNPKRRKGKSPKLQQSWEGPYKVIKQINDVVYRIQQSPRTKMKVVHIDRLTRYNSGIIHESVRDEQN